MKNKVIKMIFLWFFRLIYRVQVIGLENYPPDSERFLIIANHVSFLDGLLLAAFLPNPISFVIHSYYSNKKWLKFFFRFVNLYSVDQNNPYVLRSLVKETKNGMHCVIFPEGKISMTGTLMKIYEGPGLIADRADASLLPIHIEGPQYTPFTRLVKKSRRQFFPRITITIAPRQKIIVDPAIHGRLRRKLLASKVSDLMANTAFNATPSNKTLFINLLEAAHRFGKRKEIIEDLDRKALSYQQVILRTFVLGRYIGQRSISNEYIGILLPNTNAAVITIFALYASGRIPAILNFTSSAAVILDCCINAGIKQIYTSRQFIEKARLESTITLLATQIKIIYLEDLKQQIKISDKLVGKFCAAFPRFFYHKWNPHISANDPAVLLFTSGSEATPKSVILSHNNINANRHQLNTRFDFNKEDISINALPLFHSFGFMCLTMQLFTGLYTFYYPTPLHYRVIPEISYDINATMIYGTDTFLRGYGQCANPYDFYSIRYVLSGGEPLKKETRDLWFEKFGIRIIEGYGITETSPVIASNYHTYYKSGTVGRFVPGIEYKLQQIPEIPDENTGRLWVKGPSIFKGYLAGDQSSRIIAPKDGWYDTGDIVSIDLFGFITILGRAKRFAKIGGEMVSLIAVENYLSEFKPGYDHAVINLPDHRKGEMLLLFTECPHLIREDLIGYYKKNEISMLMIPKKILLMKTLPRTAAGKINYPQLYAEAKTALAQF